MPVFNRAGAVGQAIDSVLRQDFEDYEVIVVDDGSTDATGDVLAGYPQPRIQILRNDRNSGVARTRNRGVQAARGEWVVFLDSDNQLLPRALSVLQSETARCDQKVAVVYGKSELVGVSSGPDVRETPGRWGFDQYIAAMKIDEALPVVRRSVLLNFPFEENLGTKRECGTLVWYAIARAGYEFVWTREVVQRYTLSADSLSGRKFLSAHPEEMVACNQKILERFGGDLLRANRKKFVTMQQKTSFYCLMANCRSCALRHAWTAVRFDPFNARSYFLLLLCGLSVRVVRNMYARAAVAAA